MNAIKALLMIMVLALVVIAGCSTQKTEKTDEKTDAAQGLAAAQPIQFIQVEKTQKIEQKQATEQQKTVQSDETVYCEDVDSDVIEDNCMVNPDYVVAVASKSPNFCNGLDDYRKNECLTYLQEGETVTE